MNRYDVIHLATHALLDREHPERSALVLSQVSPAGSDPAAAGTDDGLLTGSEIADLWHLDADLVTLSACETGLGRHLIGEGVVGFAYPFLEAGARSLLVSLWKVDDRATALLMRRFYENWLGDERSSKARALRDAKRWLRDYRDPDGQRPFEHPTYWSAFVLVGDPG